MCRDKAVNIQRDTDSSTLGHSNDAPSAKVAVGELIKAAGFVPVCVPKPSHCGHQPIAELKEK